MTEEKQLNSIFYCDGSCRGNPGYAGAGVFGYTFRPSKRPKNIRHPSKAAVRFASSGISESNVELPGDYPIEVVDIIDSITAINNHLSTNNEAELLAVISALKIATSLIPVTSVKIITDSNYIVTSFNENLDRWVRNGWRKQDGKEIVHKEAWMIILDFIDLFKSRNIKLEFEWVKGHAGIYGNEMADLYSVVGSNSSKRQLEDGSEFRTDVLTSVISYEEYKRNLISKDFVFHFREMYFSSDISVDDKNYCFLNITERVVKKKGEDEPSKKEKTGKRDLASIFVTNVGYVPELLNEFKKSFRQERRTHNTPSIMMVGKLADKDLLRLAMMVRPTDFLARVDSPTGVQYKLPKDTSAFMLDGIMNYPFIMNASSIFNNTLDLSTDDIGYQVIEKDISDIFVENKKIKFSNKDRNIDLSERVGSELTFVTKPLLTVGRDTPNYLTLKSLESDIISVSMIIKRAHNTNRCSIYLKIVTSDREIFSINIENKYFVLVPKA